MTETMIVTTTIDAPAEKVFDVLADPSTHQAIDGTGWVRESLDGAPLTGTGQIFRIAMYHDNHPNGHYEMANRVEVFDRPRAIAWQPGSEAEHDPDRGDSGEDDTLEFGGWIWHYGLEQISPQQTRVTLTYDWSAVPTTVREHIEFPPFPVDHLENSLANLATLLVVRR